MRFLNRKDTIISLMSGKKKKLYNRHLLAKRDGSHYFSILDR